MHGNRLTRWLVLVLCVGSAAIAAEPPRLIYVDAAARGMGDGSSWTDAYNCLQDALAAATTADKAVEIRVAQGVYKPDQGAGITASDRTASFQLLNGVTLNGGYAGAFGADPDSRDPDRYPTILSGDLAGNDDSASPLTPSENSYCVVISSGTDDMAVIEGFVITAGAGAPGTPYGAASPSGTGLQIEAAGPTVLNCCFLGNGRSRGRAAVQAVGGSDPVLAGCSFVCSGDDAIHAEDSDVVLTRCAFHGDGTRTDGRAIECKAGNLSLRDCTFTGLYGKGVIYSTSLGAYAAGNVELIRCSFVDNFMSSESLVQSDGSVVARQCTFQGNIFVNAVGGTHRSTTAGAISGGDLELYDSDFVGNRGASAGAVVALGDVLIATGCLFSGNVSPSGPGAIQSRARVLKVSNCTFAGNRGQPNTMEHRGDNWTLKAGLTQCIIWDGPNPFELLPTDPCALSVTYSDIQGGYPGQGNIDVDPCFVQPGYWADPNDPTNEVGPDDPRAVWLAGDYHLKSKSGHWDRTGGMWIRDGVTSACIDAGNPGEPPNAEPFPNGGVINMGAYGGMAEASKSYFGEPVCETQIPGDINGDCKVNQTDLDILMAHWLEEGADFVDAPPTIVIVGPPDGAELTYPTPILVQSAASDPDGRVAEVVYTAEYRTAAGGRVVQVAVASDPANGWSWEWAWSNVRYDGKYTIWAEAMDDQGAKTASQQIIVTLHPAK